MPEKPKAIFVGPEVVSNAFRKIRKDWDFTVCVDSMKDLWDGLSNDTINDDVHIIVTLDGYFKKDPDHHDRGFEELVATMAPHCFFIIISYFPELQNRMRQSIEKTMENMGNIDSKDEYFFIDPKKPNIEIDNAVQQYISTSPNEYVVNALKDSLK